MKEENILFVSLIAAESGKLTSLLCSRKRFCDGLVVLKLVHLGRFFRTLVKANLRLKVTRKVLISSCVKVFLTAYVLLGLRLNSSSKLKDKQCKQKISQKS